MAATCTPARASTCSSSTIHTHCGGQRHYITEYTTHAERHLYLIYIYCQCRTGYTLSDVHVIVTSRQQGLVSLWNREGYECWSGQCCLSPDPSTANLVFTCIGRPKRTAVMYY